MTEQRCKHELLTAECAFCKPSAAADIAALNVASSPEAWRRHQADPFSAPGATRGPVFTASYDSECGACGGPITQGDLIAGHDDYGYVHEECLED